MNYQMKCPWGICRADSARQDFPGRCQHCNYIIADFTKSVRKKIDFKYVLGFAGYSVRKDKVCMLFECPECFQKSHIHIKRELMEKYGKWADEISIFAKDW